MHTQSIDAFRHSHVFLGYRARLFLKNQFPNGSPNSGGCYPAGRRYLFSQSRVRCQASLAAASS